MSRMFVIFPYIFFQQQVIVWMLILFLCCIFRSWDKVFVVLRGNMIFFYKDRKSYQAAPEVFFRAEAPVDVSGGTASVADDYTKKKHVMRLK